MSSHGLWKFPSIGTLSTSAASHYAGNLLYLRAPGRYKVIDMYLMLVAFTLPHWWILDSNGLPTTTSIYLNHM